MTNPIDQFNSSPRHIQNGVLYILLEATIMITMAFVDLYHGRYVWEFGPGVSFAIEMILIVAMILCGLGILYKMRVGWIGSIIFSIFLIVVGIMFMLDIITPLTLTLSGIFYFIFGAFGFGELMKREFREYCGITKE